jgi:small subunit ribosomal protein S6
MNYESTFVFSPELQTEKIEELTTKVVNIVEVSDGVVKTVQQLGKKKLAYNVKKFREGNYVYIEFSGNSGLINILENFFKFNELVIRFLTVKTKMRKIVAKSTTKMEEQTVTLQAAEVKQNDTAAK